MGELLRDALEAAALYDIVGSNDPRGSNDNDGGGTGDEPQSVAVLLSLSMYSALEAQGGWSFSLALLPAEQQRRWWWKQLTFPRPPTVLSLPQLLVQERESSSASQRQA